MLDIPDDRAAFHQPGNAERGQHYRFLNHKYMRRIPELLRRRQQSDQHADQGRNDDDPANSVNDIPVILPAVPLYPDFRFRKKEAGIERQQRKEHACRYVMDYARPRTVKEHETELLARLGVPAWEQSDPDTAYADYHGNGIVQCVVALVRNEKDGKRNKYSYKEIPEIRVVMHADRIQNPIIVVYNAPEIAYGRQRHPQQSDQRTHIHV